MLLGTDPPRLPVQLLVRTTELFGIAEGTTRTALSRMAAAGDVVAVDGSYELAAGRHLERQRRQAESRAARTRPWRGGRWLQGVVTAERRSASDRLELRASLARARLAELREGVWLRPDNLELELAPSDHLAWFRSVPDGDAAALAARLWDLEAWSARAGQLRTEMADLVDALEAHDRSALAPGFVLSADVLRQFQADPLLPDELLPAGWPGHALRTEYDRYDAAYRAVLVEWFAGHGQNRR